MRRFRGCVLLPALAAALLCGCGQRQPEVTEITLIHGWGSTEPDHAAMRKIYQDFEDLHPDIRLNLISMPTAEEVVRRASELTTVGQVPDILFFGGTSTPSIYHYMADHGSLLDLMPYLQRDGDFAQSVPAAVYQTWQREDGALYTLCDTLLFSGGYWYNKQLLAQAGIREIPATWEEFSRMKAQFEQWAAHQGTGAVLMQPSADGYLYLLEHDLAERGYTDPDAPIPPEQIAQALRWVKEHFPADQTAGETYSYRDETKRFNSGDIAIYINGVWAAQMIDETLQAEYALLPSGGASYGCISANIGYVLGKTGDEQREAASVAFLKYMLSDAVQERILTETGQMPASPRIRTADYALEKPRFCQAVDTVQRAEETLATPEVLFTKQQTQILKENILSLLCAPEDPAAALLRLFADASADPGG